MRNVVNLQKIASLKSQLRILDSAEDAKRTIGETAHFDTSAYKQQSRVATGAMLTDDIRTLKQRDELDYKINKRDSQGSVKGFNVGNISDLND